MSFFASNQYDVVVCGAGPAGLMAACTLGRLTAGARRILLLDRKEPWKEPIFCAEAVSTRRLMSLWPIDPSFVRGNLSGIYFTSPKRYRAEFYSKDCGLQLNRSALHKNIADECVKSGVECHFDTVAQKLERVEDGWNLVVSRQGVEETIRSTIIIDTTGPGAKLTRNISCLEGMEDGSTDLEPAIFAVAEGIPHSREHIELFFGSEFKDGYGWIFPRDGKEVNIGLVLGKNVKSDISLRQRLLDFINRDYPGATIKGIYGGKIACGQSDKPIAKCGLFKAGDSASCVNPISRSGITESLLCGKIVAEAASEWLNASAEERPTIEANATKRWMKEMGNSHMQIARGKTGFNQITDEQFDKAALRLSKMPREKQTIFRIFFNVLWASPALVWKMRSFLHW